MDSYQGGGQPDWQLLLVNDWNPLPSGYDSDVSFTTVSGGKQMDSRITDIVEQMLRDASAYDLAVVSAYRPKEEQNTLYWRKVKQYTDKGYSDLEAQKVGGTIVKRPGFSEHNCGLAMDVGGSGDYTLEQTVADGALRRLWLHPPFPGGQGGYHRRDLRAVALPLCGRGSSPIHHGQ